MAKMEVLQTENKAVRAQGSGAPRVSEGGVAPRPPEGGEAPRPPEGGVVPSVLKSANPKLYVQLEGWAKAMRVNPTEAEAALWEQLRNKKLGMKFRQQHVIDRFIVDFCSIKAGIVVEVDGEVHKSRENADEARTEILESQGYRVIRFKNEEVLNDIDKVLAVIKNVAPRPPEGGEAR